MDRWNNLIWRIKTSAWWNYLPPELREPPWMWLVLAALVLAALLVAVVVVRWLLRRLGGGVRRGRVVAEGRAQSRRDLDAALTAGDLLEAAKIHQALGEDGRALDVLARGGHHEERVALLLRQERREQAREVAREHGVWHVVAELAEEDGDAAGAALAWERAGKAFLAARAWETAGDVLQSARCYTAAGLEAEAARVAASAEGPEAAEVLEAAVRATLIQAKGRSMSLGMSQAVRRSVQLWLAEGEVQRAWRLAVDSEHFDVAAPIAKDFLEPTPEAAEICLAAGALLAAADVWKRLDRPLEEARARAEHHERRGHAAEAAHWLERAGEPARAADQWAAAGEPRKAADLYAQVGELQTAAGLYAQAGDEVRQQEMLLRLETSSRAADFTEEPTVRAGGPTSRVPGAEESQVVTVGPMGRQEAAPARYSTLLPAADAAAAGVQPDGSLAEGRYRLLEELGRGGMGRVYRAEDTMLQRQVAYKVLPETLLVGDPGGADALLAEARAAARLSHPNIVQVYDVGRRGQGVFVVMELVRGPTFESLLQQQEMSVPWLRRIGGQIAAALAHAHARQIVHRDLKPSNLLWSGAEELVKLTDFGLARATDESSGKVATRPAGTPSYMSPEQIRGDDLDHRADLYAFGCVLYEMATGRSVFSGGIGSLQEHLGSQPEDPRHHRSDLDDDVAELILDCLQKDPLLRPSSAADVQSRLAAA